MKKFSVYKKKKKNAMQATAEICKVYGNDAVSVYVAQ